MKAHRFVKEDALARIEIKVEKLENRIERVVDFSWSQFRWIMGTLLAIFVTIVFKGSG